MKTANAETIVSVACGLVLFLLGSVATLVAILSIFPALRPWFHVSEFRIDFIILGPMVILLSETLLLDIFKRDGKKVKKSIR